MADKLVDILDTSLNQDGLVKLTVSASIVDSDRLTLPSVYVSPFVLASSFKSGKNSIDSVTGSDGLVKILSAGLISATPAIGFIILRKAEEKEGVGGK